MSADPPRLVHQIVADKSASHPHSAAITDGDNVVTYTELEHRANAVARSLIDAGAVPDSVVAVALPPSAELLIALLGVLKSGAAYLPLEPAQPADRLRQLIRDATPAAILGSPGHTGGIERDFAVMPVTAALSAACPERQISADNLAYVIYTSGSTGRPKGIAMTHKVLANLLAWQASPRGLGAEPVRTLQRTTITFDVAFQEIFGTWVTGGTVVVANEEQRHDFGLLWDIIVRQGVERIYMPFGPLQELARAYHPSRHADAVLKDVVCAGEPIELTDETRSWFGRLPGVRLVNHYGPSETHVATGHVLTGDPRTWPGSPPIGQPVTGVTVRVLGADLREVSDGETGELYVGGNAVPRGYLHQPSLTAGRLIPDLTGGEPGARLYRTGDLGRRQPDGTLTFLGRIDDQVKIKGFRVEPGEVRARLSAHPAVRECAVAARPGARRRDQLVAYIVPADQPPTVGSLRRFLAEILPEYMIPQAFVLLPALPRTLAGKLDPRALPSPGSARPLLDTPFQPPGNPLEERLTALFADVLETAPVGVADDFFELGGDSIAAMRLAALVATELGTEFGVEAILQARTVSAICARLGAAGLAPVSPQAKRARPAPQRSAHATRVPQAPGPPQDVRPSPNQERLLALCEMYPGAAVAYQEPLALSFRGPLDLGVLSDALAAIAQRYEVLRTRFATTDGRFTAVVDAKPRIDLIVEESDDRGEDQVTSWAASFAGQRLALAQAHPLRAGVLRLAPDYHVLVVVIHHVAWDGWSAVLFERQLRDCYACLADGRRPQEPAGLMPFGELADRQRSRAESGLVLRQTQQRRAAIADTPSILTLPHDRVRPPISAFRGGTIRRELDSAAQLTPIAADQSATMPMAVLALFGAVLALWSGQPRLIVGITVLGRPVPEMEPLVGFFANSVPVTMDLSARPGFADLLAQVRDEVTAVLHAQEARIEQLATDIADVRGAGQRPLLQVMFADQGSVRRSWRVGELVAEPLDVHNGTAKFDLTLQVERDGARYHLVLEYDGELFDRVTAERVLDWVNELAVAVAAKPTAAMHGLKAGPSPVSIATIFSRQAATTPARIAVSDRDGELSYADLDSAAEHLARALVCSGAGPGTIVGVCLPRSVVVATAILAVVKTGACYVPLDSEYPSARLAYIVNDSKAAIVITPSYLAGHFSGTDAVLIDPATHAVRPGIRVASAVRAATVIAPHAPAYVIYTSGSTGEPKGVVVTHANVVRLFSATATMFNFDERDVWALFHSVAFDFSVWEMWGALLHGGRLVIVDEESRRSPGKFWSLLCEEGVTIVNQTPSAFKQLLAAHPGNFSGSRLRWLVFGGERLDPEILRPWYQLAGSTGPRIANMYGITETTVHVTFKELQWADCDRQGSPIGRPLPDLTLTVLGEDGRPVRQGETGELYVGGPGVSQGYLRRPGLTAERFLPDPYGQPSARLYRTGDLVRQLSVDEFDYIGRVDHQVKVHGYRIEPGEIAAVLMRHPDVADAAVILQTADSTPRLLGYIVPRAGANPAPADIRNWLRERLPAHMVPAAVISIAAVPVTPQGKLNRDALPAAGHDRPNLPRSYEPPRGDAEQALLGAWEHVLQVSGIGRNDTFTELGGDSIMAIRIVAEAARRGVSVSVADLARCETIASLAASAAAAPGDRPETAPHGLLHLADAAALPAGVTDAYPMTPLQIGMLFHSEIAQDVTLYHDLIGLTVGGPFDEAAFAAVLDRMAARHDVLRTSFALIGFSVPLQLVHEQARIPLEVHAGGQHAIEEWRAEEMGRSFNWAAPPLMRCRVIVLSADRFFVGLAVHHSILDGWSIAKLTAEMLTSYNGVDISGPASARVRYRDYVGREIEDGGRPETKAFWRDTVAGAEPVRLPAAPGEAAAGAGTLLVPLGTSTSGSLTDRARRLGASLKTLMLAAHVKALAALADTADITSGLVVNGRLEAEGGDDALGLFLNTVPFRIAVSDASWLDLCSAVRGTEAALLPYRRCPAAEIQKLTGGPLFDIVFNYTHFYPLDELRSSSPARLIDTWTWERSNFGLMAEVMVEAGNEIAVSASYDGQRVTRAQASAYIDTYLRMLSAAIGDDIQSARQ